jgi:PBP1b-binding outer membrane lipoprotein LpoB
MDQRNKTSISGWARGASVLALITLLLSGCATTPMAPTASLDAARDAIASAEQNGARQHAGAELDEARQQLDRAEVAVGDERMDDAQRNAELATVTAELASAKTDAAKADQINRQIRRSAEALNEEMRRTGEQQ